MRKGMCYAEKWLRQMDMSKSFKNPSKTMCTDLRLAMLLFPAEPQSRAMMYKVRGRVSVS